MICSLHSIIEIILQTSNFKPRNPKRKNQTQDFTSSNTTFNNFDMKLTVALISFLTLVAAVPVDHNSAIPLDNTTALAENETYTEPNFSGAAVEELSPMGPYSISLNLLKRCNGWGTNAMKMKRGQLGTRGISC